MDRRSFGELLRQWRRLRHLSQLDLAVVSGVSARHLSFLETGRSLPSREMVLKLAECLGVPLRQRNPMLESAGFAPMYRTRAWNDPELRPALRSVGTVLAAHNPHPALALDRLYNVVEANSAAAALLRKLLPQWETSTINVVRATLHPRGLAPHILNFRDWRADVLMRLDQQVQRTGDGDLSALRQEVGAYPVPGDSPVAKPACPNAAPDVILPLEVRVGEEVLRFITTMTVFGSPHDILLQDMAIETFFAADEPTVRFLRSMVSPDGAATDDRGALPDARSVLPCAPGSVG